MRHHRRRMFRNISRQPKAKRVRSISTVLFYLFQIRSAAINSSTRRTSVVGFGRLPATNRMRAESTGEKSWREVSKNSAGPRETSDSWQWGHFLEFTSIGSKQWRHFKSRDGSSPISLSLRSIVVSSSLPRGVTVPSTSSAHAKR